MEEAFDRSVRRRRRKHAQEPKKIVTLRIANISQFVAIVTGLTRIPVSMKANENLQPAPVQGTEIGHVAAIMDPDSPTPMPKRVDTPGEVTMADSPGEGDGEGQKEKVIRKLDFTSDSHLGSSLGFLNVPTKRKLAFTSEKDKTPANREIDTTITEADRPQMPPPLHSAGSARSRRQDDEVFDMFVNQDMLESPEKGSASRVAVPEPSTPSIFGFPETSPVSIEDDQPHAYPKVAELIQASQTRVELQSEWLDTLRRPLDPTFSNDETWADGLYFPEELIPYGDIVPAKCCKEFSNNEKDRKATFQGLMQLAEQRVPIKKVEGLAQRDIIDQTAKYLTKVINPPSDADLKAKEKADFDGYFKNRKAFKEIPRAVMDEGRQVPTGREKLTPVIASMKPGANDTLMGMNSLFDDPDYADFCSTARFGMHAEKPNTQDPEKITMMAEKRGQLIMKHRAAGAVVHGPERARSAMPEVARPVTMSAHATTQLGSPFVFRDVRPPASTISLSPPVPVIPSTSGGCTSMSTSPKGTTFSHAMQQPIRVPQQQSTLMGQVQYNANQQNEINTMIQRQRAGSTASMTGQGIGLHVTSPNAPQRTTSMPNINQQTFQQGPGRSQSAMLASPVRQMTSISPQPAGTGSIQASPSQQGQDLGFRNLMSPLVSMVRPQSMVSGSPRQGMTPTGAAPSMSIGQGMAAVQTVQEMSSQQLLAMSQHFGNFSPPGGSQLPENMNFAVQQQQQYVFSGREVSRDEYLQYARMLAYQNSHTSLTEQNMTNIQDSALQMPARVATGRAASIVPITGAQRLVHPAQASPTTGSVMSTSPSGPQRLEHLTSRAPSLLQSSIWPGSSAYMQQGQGVYVGQSVVRPRRGVPGEFTIHEDSDMGGVADSAIDPRLLSRSNTDLE